MDRREKALAHQTARRVPAFRPRIGKHEVECGDRIRRQEPLDGVGNLDAQDTRVRHAGALDLSTGSADTPEQALNPEEVFGRVCGCRSREEGAVATTEIDFDRGITTENRRQIKEVETIGRDELGLACYGWSRIGGHVR